MRMRKVLSTVHKKIGQKIQKVLLLSNVPDDARSTFAPLLHLRYFCKPLLRFASPLGTKLVLFQTYFLHAVCTGSCTFSCYSFKNHQESYDLGAFIHPAADGPALWLSCSTSEIR